jgi:hypothetical protein
MVSIASCAINKEKEMAKESGSPSFHPKPLDDQWSKWLVGEWEGWGEADAGAGKCRTKIELGLNGQFLIMKGEGETGEMTPEHIKYLKETLHASDEEIKRLQSSTFKELQIHTIDPKTGEIIGYLFDSLRCIAEGAGKREGNKEIIEWEWSAGGQGTSIRIREKVSENKFIINHKYTLPDVGDWNVLTHQSD